MKFSAKVPIAEVPPRYMGVAWEDWERRRTVFIVFPFNWLCRWARSIYWTIRRALLLPRPDWIDRTILQAETKAWIACAEGKQKAWADGYEAGKESAWQSFRAELSNAVKEENTRRANG